MQKKKSPVMLVVAVCLVFGFAYFMNATSFFTRPLLPEQPQQPEPAPQTQASTEEATAQTRTAMKDALRNRGGRDQEDAEGRAEGIPDKPAIFVPRIERFEPTFNETSTSAQWYRDESEVDDRGEKVRAERGF